MLCGIFFLACLEFNERINDTICKHLWVVIKNRVLARILAKQGSRNKYITIKTSDIRLLTSNKMPYLFT
jgi:hypothetical protein